VEHECRVGEIPDVQKKPKALANRLISPVRPTGYIGNIETLEEDAVRLR
jgi:hypothetical protein